MADEEDDASKTEDPSEKKLSKAKDEGQIASSQEIKNWAVLLGATAILIMLAPKLAEDVSRVGSHFIANAHDMPEDISALQYLFQQIIFDIGVALAPSMAILVALAIAAGLAQSGLIWAWPKIKPKLSNISLIKGAKQKFSMKALVEFAKGMFKLGIVSTAMVFAIMPFMSHLGVMAAMNLYGVLDEMWKITILMVMASVAVMTVLAAADYAYSKYTHLKQMRMTKQEVKDEHKQAEGDPQIKARIRRVRMERAQRRMMANVPKADVVITNPTHFAVALEYKPDSMPAPRCLAKGVDSVAFKIREIADFHDIAIVENPMLARALYATVEIDEEIPQEHYQAVAEVIGFVFRKRGKPMGTAPGG